MAEWAGIVAQKTAADLHRSAKDVPVRILGKVQVFQSWNSSGTRCVGRPRQSVVEEASARGRQLADPLTQSPLRRTASREAPRESRKLAQSVQPGLGRALKRLPTFRLRPKRLGPELERRLDQAHP